MAQPDGTTQSRRAFLLAGVGMLLAGCSSGATRLTGALPEPTWSDLPRSTPRPPRYDPPARPDWPDREPAAPSPSLPGGVIARGRWAGGNPVPALMDRMLPVKYITIHHDGMTPFYATDERSAADRLESIRRAHRSNNWGDIGYHFSVDRGGRIWECRPLSWQGAHVKDCNPGNVGVMCLGNFELQQPSSAQLASLQHIVRTLARQHGVSASRIRTHREWAPTACPGRTLQARVNAMRSAGRLA